MKQHQVTSLKMQRFHQFIFIVSLLALSWFAMMAIHELGHVVGALGTGGTIERVVLHPLTISRTDVSPNPSPSIVVWLGPILGCAIPVAMWLSVPKKFIATRNIALFFAGFCLLANGSYIAIGAFEGIGDCGVMLQLGSPVWLLCAFGLLTIPLGFYAWHCLGSVKEFIANPKHIDPILAYGTLIILLVLLLAEFAFSRFRRGNAC